MYYRFPGPVGIIVILVLLMIMLGMVQQIIAPGTQLAPAPLPFNDPTGQPAAPVGSTVNPQPSRAVPPVDPAETRRQLEGIRQQLAAAVADCESTAQQITAWTAAVVALRENAEGRAIATSPDLARKLAFLLDEPRPTQQEVTRNKDRLSGLVWEVEQLSIQQPPAMVSPPTLLEIGSLTQQARTTRELWVKAVESVQAIGREAQRQAVAANTASTPPAVSPPLPATVPSSFPPVSSAAPPGQEPTRPAGGVTGDPAPLPPTVAQPQQAAPAVTEPVASTPMDVSLDKALQQVRDEAKLEELNRQIAQEAERRREEEQRRVAAEKAELERVAAKAKLIAEAQLPEVQLALQPFLTPHSVQPRLAGSSLQFSRTVDEQPMSYTAINGIGALAESVQGLSMLARLGSHRDLNGPRWSFSPSPRVWSADDQAKLKHAQDLLRRLGPTLVELNLLAP